MCASGMKSVMLGATAIQIGHRDIILAGGFESMSRAPHYLNIRKPSGYGHVTAIDAIACDGLTDVYSQ